MQRKWIVAVAIAWASVGGSMAADAPDVEAAYKKGQADWDRGDPVSAMPSLKTAADGGHAAAQALYGYILDQADNDAEAATYYRKAAEQNNPEGLFGLAVFHVSGDGDVKPDPLEARRLFLRAAEAGHKQAVVVIVMAYLEGGLGFTAEDMKSAEALRWFKKGAEQGSIPALERLIQAHRAGELGLPVDAAEADRLQARIFEIQGIDPSATRKRRQRR